METQRSTFTGKTQKETRKHVASGLRRRRFSHPPTRSEENLLFEVQHDWLELRNQTAPQIQQAQLKPNSLVSPIRSHIFDWALVAVTCASVGFTIFFAHNCSLEAPRSRTLIFSDPKRTILALNILSQITIFLLSQLTNGLFENVRWAFASSKRGIPALSFYAMGPSTRYRAVFIIFSIGVMRYLQMQTCPRISPITRDSYWLWSFQKYSTCLHH
jgi:hypothetical protein